MAEVGELTGWLRRLNVAMWLLAGVFPLVEAYRRQGAFPLECLAWSGVAYGLCWISFLYAHRTAGRPRRSDWPVAAAMATQLLMVLFLASWWRGLFGGFLLVLTAWQGALLWPLRRSLQWVGIQTGALALVALGSPDPLAALMMAAVIGGLQALAVLAAHTTRCESEARLALARTHAELRSAHHLLLQGGRAAERMRLARELHDGMGHQLTALSLDLEVALQQTDGPARQSVSRARAMASGLLAEVRQVVSQLREDRNIDLPAALAAVIANIRKPRIHLEHHGPVGAIDAARAQAIVRCVQEFITNAIRHASAENLWLEVAVDGDMVTLAVRDDGRGAASLREGYGLRGMRERVSQLGGGLEIHQAVPGFGARVWLPFRGASA